MAASRGPRNEKLQQVPVGYPSAQSLETISHIKIRDLRKPLRLTLVGAIHMVGDKRLASIIPRAVLLHRENNAAEPRFGVVTLGEKDPAEGDAIVKAFELRHRSKKAVGFQVVVESDQLTYGDVISGAESGKLGSKSPADVRISAGYRFAGSDKWMISSAWPAQMFTSHELGINNIVAVWDTWTWFAFDCHAHWESMIPGFGRWTWCHDTKPCLTCHITGTTPPVAIGKGWCTCKC